MDSQLFLVFNIAVLLYSVTIHEVSHGVAAYALGDQTAKLLGRLSLNPLRHLDFFGSFIMPLVLYVAGLPVFGYAKPVPYNPMNLDDRRWGPAKVAFAGPLSNLILALLFGFLLRLMGYFFFSETLFSVLAIITYINLVLAVFNLFPVPPLDGHWILTALLPVRLTWIRDWLYQYSLILFVIFIVFFLPVVSQLTSILFTLITGQHFG